MQAFFSRASGPADRTDADGQFHSEFTMYPKFRAEVVHFASPDFVRQAIAVVRYDDPDRPFEITVKPLRRVRARVVETPTDHPEQNLSWNVYAVDPVPGGLDEGEIAKIGEKAARAQTGYATETDQQGIPRAPRLFETDLPPGRYKIGFESDTVSQLTEITVAPGKSPLELPDIRLELNAWFKMLGKPAAEINAVDAGGKPVKLAGFRGKAVVLCFWSSKYESDSPTLPLLAQIQKKFTRAPLVILVLHDASITSLASFNEAVAPLRAQLKGEVPAYFLLDQPPGPAGLGPYRRRAGEYGSGQTIAPYEADGIGSTFVIDKAGKLASATEEIEDRSSTFSIGQTGEVVYDFGEISMDNLKFDREFGFSLIGRALEDVVGLPRSPLPKPKPERIPPVPSNSVATAIRGQVVDLEGRPIAGARVAKYLDIEGESAVTTGKTGEFVFRPQAPGGIFELTIKAPGFAARRISFELQDPGGEAFLFATTSPST